MNKLLVILGSTATGKTDLALKLAKKFNGEIVACDSRQVYQGLDIGTGKLPSKKSKVKKKSKYWEINGVKVWMYDVVSLKTQYTVYDYVKEASKVVAQIVKKNRLPIVVGGTGLYLKALIEGLANLSIPVNINLRRELEKLSLQQLQTKLQELDSKKWQALNNSDRKNKRRLLRSIELIHMYPYTGSSKGLVGLNNNFDILKIGLTSPRKVLYERINSVCLTWFRQGILNEVRDLLEQGISVERFKQLGLEYGILADFISGQAEGITNQELTIKIQHKVHQYAKRQQTWFKKEQDVFWFDKRSKNWSAKVEKLASDWYNT